MADLTAIFGILLVLGIAFPGLLAAWWLLFPHAVERARLRLEKTPGRCLGLGLGLALVALIPILIFLNLPFGPAKFTGWVMAALVLVAASVGAAGLAGRMGAQLTPLASRQITPAGAFVRGAVVLELAAVFPVIGWLVFLPLTTLAALGAAAFAILRWMPGTAVHSVDAALPQAQV